MLDEIVGHLYQLQLRFSKKKLETFGNERGKKMNKISSNMHINLWAPNDNSRVRICIHFYTAQNRSQTQSYGINEEKKKSQHNKMELIFMEHRF